MRIFPPHPSLDQNLLRLKGVGPQTYEALERRGFRRLGDLLTLMPNRYQDRRRVVGLADLAEGDEGLVWVEVTKVGEGKFPKTRRRYFELTVKDSSETAAALWFSFPPHLRKSLKSGDRLVMFGRMSEYKGRRQMVHPEIVAENPKKAPSPEVRPVYPDFDGIKPGLLRRIVAGAVDELAGLPNLFPRSFLDAHGLTDPVAALKIIHRPPADRPGQLPKPPESKAWGWLAFFELFLLQLTLGRLRRRTRSAAGRALTDPRGLMNDYLDALPFQLTAHQTEALGDIRDDLARPAPMHRLLQGDVGSGKTVVAHAAAMIAVGTGVQAAIMAPTEVLARQHFEQLEPLAHRLGFRCRLLAGGLPEPEKAEIHEELAAGDLDLVVGTHALIAAGATFHHLGLAVIDEQHRFGVAQRMALRAKADRPDLLVLTATPIPRSLALTLYGDLDLTVIRGRPPGRSSVTTEVFGPDRRERAYQVLAAEAESGGRAFVVAPRIEAQEEEGDRAEPAAAEELADFLRRRLPGLNVGLVHGRMKSDRQRAVMDDFRAGRIDVLAATTVVEVGLDVPEATVMLIESADRFGLAQLHQLRGRIGRGSRPGRCLIVSDLDPADAPRLEIMARTGDGFVLAEEDLKMRGPGDVAGVRQSGLPSLNWAALPKDIDRLLQARDLAEKVLDRDPELNDPAFKLVREVVGQVEEDIQFEAERSG